VRNRNVVWEEKDFRVMEILAIFVTFLPRWLDTLVFKAQITDMSPFHCLSLRFHLSSQYTLLGAASARDCCRRAELERRWMKVEITTSIHFLNVLQRP
jgi:hypothetical protein